MHRKNMVRERLHRQVFVLRKNPKRVCDKYQEVTSGAESV